MKKEILIIQNITHEGLGLFEAVLEKRDVIHETVDLNLGQNIPSFRKPGAVVVFGGPDSANDDSDKMRTELAFVREVLDAKIPYLGICLGLQILVKAAGGKVMKSPVKEIGFRDTGNNRYTVELTEAGRKDLLFRSLPNKFDVFQLHGETVELNSGMTLLATAKHCMNQVVRVGQNAYGIQCHFELTPEMFARWTDHDNDLMKFDKNRLHSDYEEIKEEYENAGIQLFNNFLDIAGF